MNANDEYGSFRRYVLIMHNKNSYSKLDAQQFFVVIGESHELKYFDVYIHMFIKYVDII